MRVLSLQSAAPIAAFTGDLLPEAEPPWTRRHSPLFFLAGCGKGRSAAEDEAGRLFCFALQSRVKPGGGK
jgi:hypothetical protein